MSTDKKITVYSQPNCVACNATYRALTKKGIPYEVVDLSLSENSEQMARIKSLGYREAPVVFYGEEHWSGYNPEKINTIAV